MSTPRPTDTQELHELIDTLKSQLQKYILENEHLRRELHAVKYVTHPTPPTVTYDVLFWGRGY